jgi:hypothetical protein
MIVTIVAGNFLDKLENGTDQEHIERLTRFTDMHIGREVEKFLRRSDMPPTKFGRLAINDPRLVQDLRNGRRPGARVARRITAFIAEQDSRV